MDNYLINCPYYLVFLNQECLHSSLPDGVSYDNHHLQFQNREPVEIQIVYDLGQSEQLEIIYEFSKHTQVQIIETKLLKPEAKLSKKYYLKDNAHVSLFSENDIIHHDVVTCLDEVHLDRDASIQSGYAELSNGNIDAEYLYFLDGENASAKLRMAALSEMSDRKKYTVSIKHLAPNSHGQMDNYGVVKDKGRLTIDGIGTITKGQHASSNHQTNKIMIFDKDCIASANPYLFIDDFDVKASHAAGVGKMDEDHLYYLQSRGLTKKQAMQLITYGYLKPVVEVIDNEKLREHFEQVLSKVGA